MSALDWMSDANCATTDAELFFPEVGDRAEPAKRICAECPVIEMCEQYAIDNGFTHGVWGGKAASELRAIRTANSTGHGTRTKYLTCKCAICVSAATKHNRERRHRNRKADAA